MKFSVSALALGLAASASASSHGWDKITHGAEVLSQRSTNTKSDSFLADYSMRSRIVDPSSLKIDTVKQLSGYLDDDANDKHLFFCMTACFYISLVIPASVLMLIRVLRIAQRSRQRSRLALAQWRPRLLLHDWSFD